MENRILVNFASRSRPEKFFDCIDNIFEMVDGFAQYLIVAKLDFNDPRAKDYQSGLMHRPQINVVWGDSKNKIDAINRDVPKDGWDILINMSDDIKWTQKGFDSLIIAHMEEDCFLHFPEEYADSQAKIKERQTICVVSIMDKKYYDRFGYVYHPDYKSLWCDNEATEVARKLGRYKFVNKKLFDHLHPAAGKGEMDAQYKHTESFYHKDKRTFERRKANNFQ